jgi:capsular polysaccharide biosynthesis protein
MNLIEYARIVLRRGWIALLLAVIVAVSTFAFSQTVTPVFRASQTILLVPIRTDFGLAQAAVTLLNQHRAYLDSDIVAARIIDDLNLDYAPSQLRSQTTITANRDNLSIQIDVDLPAPDAEAAARLVPPIAAAWGQELILFRDSLNQDASREDIIRARIRDNPQLGQLQPNPRIYTVIGAIAGLFLGVIVIFVLEYLESNIIRRRSDLEDSAGLKVLATVPGE